MFCFCLELSQALESGISGKVATAEPWTARLAGARCGATSRRAGGRTPARRPVLRHPALGAGPKRSRLFRVRHAGSAAVVIRMLG